MVLRQKIAIKSRTCTENWKGLFTLLLSRFKTIGKYVLLRFNFYQKNYAHQESPDSLCSFVRWERNPNYNRTIQQSYAQCTRLEREWFHKNQRRWYERNTFSREMYFDQRIPREKNTKSDLNPLFLRLLNITRVKRKMRMLG